MDIYERCQHVSATHLKYLGHDYRDDDRPAAETANHYYWDRRDGSVWVECWSDWTHLTVEQARVKIRTFADPEDPAHRDRLLAAIA